MYLNEISNCYVGNYQKNPWKSLPHTALFTIPRRKYLLNFANNIPISQNTLTPPLNMAVYSITFPFSPSYPLQNWVTSLNYHAHEANFLRILYIQHPSSLGNSNCKKKLAHHVQPEPQKASRAARRAKKRVTLPFIPYTRNKERRARAGGTESVQSETSPAIRGRVMKLVLHFQASQRSALGGWQTETTTVVAKSERGRRWWTYPSRRLILPRARDENRLDARKKWWVRGPLSLALSLSFEFRRLITSVHGEWNKRASPAAVCSLSACATTTTRQCLPSRVAQEGEFFGSDPNFA